jgi:nucleoside phosphorylase
MKGIAKIIESCRDFKKVAIEILGVEQSIYKVEEFHGLYEIAILTANIDEFDAVKVLISNVKPSTFNQNDSTIYYTGEIDVNGRIVKAIIPFPYAMGIEASSALTTKVISTFRPKYIFMAGTCAGNKNVTKIGDVIVAEKSLNYHGVVEIERKDHTHERKFMHNISSINGNLKNKLELFSKSSALKVIKANFHQKDKIQTPLSCHVGLLVTGSSLVRSSKIIEEITAAYLGVKGLDMETYGLYYASTQVFKDYAPNFVSIKSVSDYGDDSSNKLSAKERKEYALFTSSSAVIAFIKSNLE